MITTGFPEVRRIQISSVRGWSAREFRKMTDAVLVECHSDPVAVVLPYAEYLRMQAALVAALEAERAAFAGPAVPVAS